jgi:glycine/serine hydroxymethyltransferase
MTTVGMKEGDMRSVARLIITALRGRESEAVLDQVRTGAAELMEAFPAYPEGFPGHV